MDKKNHFVFYRSKRHPRKMTRHKLMLSLYFMISFQDLKIWRNICWTARHNTKGVCMINRVSISTNKSVPSMLSAKWKIWKTFFNLCCVSLWIDRVFPGVFFFMATRYSELKLCGVLNAFSSTSFKANGRRSQNTPWQLTFSKDIRVTSHIHVQRRRPTCRYDC